MRPEIEHFLKIDHFRAEDGSGYEVGITTFRVCDGSGVLVVVLAVGVWVCVCVCVGGGVSGMRP